MKTFKKKNPNENQLLHFQLAALIVLALVNFAFKTEWVPEKIVMEEIKHEVPENIGINIIPELPKPKQNLQVKSTTPKLDQVVVVPEITPLSDEPVIQSLPELNLGEIPNFIKSENKQDKVKYSIPDANPVFSLGNKRLVSYIEDRLTFPENREGMQVGCAMKIAIIIDEKGNAIGCDFIHISEDEFDFQSQVLEVVKKLPKFKPAVRNNEYKIGRVFLDVVFILE